jgi:phage terminase large subunit-like protein
MYVFFVGVDFGQTKDFTTIAVVERAETTGGTRRSSPGGRT